MVNCIQGLSEAFLFYQGEYSLNKMAIATVYRKEGSTYRKARAQAANCFTTGMKMVYSPLSICDTKSGHPPAELIGTGDPDGTTAPVNSLSI